MSQSFFKSVVDVSKVRKAEGLFVLGMISLLPAIEIVAFHKIVDVITASDDNGINLSFLYWPISLFLLFISIFD